MQLLIRLAASYGAAAASGDSVEHAFPRPQDLAHESPGALRRFGFTQQKSRALIELSQTIAGGRLDLGSLEDSDNLTAPAAPTAPQARSCRRAACPETMAAIRRADLFSFTARRPLPGWTHLIRVLCRLFVSN